MLYLLLDIIPIVSPGGPFEYTGGKFINLDKDKYLNFGKFGLLSWGTLLTVIALQSLINPYLISFIDVNFINNEMISLAVVVGINLLLFRLGVLHKIYYSLNMKI